jgi:hypothetical protein
VQQIQFEAIKLCFPSMQYIVITTPEYLCHVALSSLRSSFSRF